MKYFSLLPAELWEQIFLYSKMQDIRNISGMLPEYVLRSLRTKELWIRRGTIQGIPNVYLNFYDIILTHPKFIKVDRFKPDLRDPYVYMNNYENMRFIYNKFSIDLKAIKIDTKCILPTIFFNHNILLYDQVDSSEINHDRLKCNYSLYEFYTIFTLSKLPTNGKHIMKFIVLDQQINCIIDMYLRVPFTDDEYILFMIKYNLLYKYKDKDYTLLSVE